MLRQELSFSRCTRLCKLWKVTCRHSQFNSRGPNGSDATSKKHSKSKPKLQSLKLGKTIRHYKPNPVLTATRSTANKHLKKANAEKGEEVFAPVQVEPEVDQDSEDIGAELVGDLTAAELSTALREFISCASVHKLAESQNITDKIYIECCRSFRQYVITSKPLPVELHITLKDLARGKGHPTNLFPFFLQHAKMVYPHLDCLDDLKKISDLTDPPNWYPKARNIVRKIIYHAGPTNSGKTYHALKRFKEAETGVYCGPLRLLAMEVYDKCKTEGLPCDLVTGETRIFANEDGSNSGHISCTVEMTNTENEYDVAVIDEIQLIGDIQRGWAWTRALLGVCAREIHVCGEETAIDLVEQIALSTGDEFEVRRYERLTKLEYLDEPLESFENVRPGDCIVCFSKKQIFRIANKLTLMGKRVAVIYGGLPPGTKIKMSQQFNDPDNACDILVATDAVGMGLNLAIKRVIFYSLLKKSVTEENVSVSDYLTSSHAQQIAGRAGRFRTQYEDGEVTAFVQKDLTKLRSIVETPKTQVQKAGLKPTQEMVEMFSYHLPKASLTKLLEIFLNVSKTGDLYKLCNIVDFLDLAKVIEDLPLTLSMQFTLCLSPMNIKHPFTKVIFRKLALWLSTNRPLTFTWLYNTLEAPFSRPKTLTQLEQLEAKFDVVDIYLWLSFRYPSLFLDIEQVQELRLQIDSLIQSYFISVKQTIRNFNEAEKLINTELEVDKELIESNPLQAYKSSATPAQKFQDGETDLPYKYGDDVYTGNIVKKPVPDIEVPRDEVLHLYEQKNVVTDVFRDLSLSSDQKSVEEPEMEMDSQAVWSDLDSEVTSATELGHNVQTSEAIPENASHLSVESDSEQRIESLDTQSQESASHLTDVECEKPSFLTLFKAAVARSREPERVRKRLLAGNFDVELLSVTSDDFERFRNRPLTYRFVDEAFSKEKCNFDTLATETQCLDADEDLKDTADIISDTSDNEMEGSIKDMPEQPEKASSDSVPTETGTDPELMNESDSLTSRLVKDGVISEELLNQLRLEWEQDKKKDSK